MSASFHQVLSILDSHGYDIDTMHPKELAELIYDITQTLGIQVPQFKDNRTSIYRLRGYKVKDAIETYSENHNTPIYMSVINLGEMPLRDPDTVSLARLLTEKSTPSEVPQRHKIERGLTRNSLIHVHSIYPSKKKPPSKIRHKGKTYKVSTVKLGDNPKYTGTLTQQLTKAVKYLFKPSNITGTENHNKKDLKHAAYLEWFLDKVDGKQTQGVRLSWNKNIK